MAALILPAATAAELVERQGADVFVWRDYAARAVGTATPTGPCSMPRSFQCTAAGR